MNERLCMCLCSMQIERVRRAFVRCAVSSAEYGKAVNGGNVECAIFIGVGVCEERRCVVLTRCANACTRADGQFAVGHLRQSATDGRTAGTDTKRVGYEIESDFNREHIIRLDLRCRWCCRWRFGLVVRQQQQQRRGSVDDYDDHANRVSED